MVIHRRLTALACSFALYCVAGAVGTYFVWHAANGQRGLKAKAEYKREMLVLSVRLTQLQAEKARWTHRVELLRGETIDRDLLDEQARQVLGRVNAADLIVMLPKGDR